MKSLILILALIPTMLLSQESVVKTMMDISTNSPEYQRRNELKFDKVDNRYIEFIKDGDTYILNTEDNSVFYTTSFDEELFNEWKNFFDEDYPVVARGYDKDTKCSYYTYDNGGYFVTIVKCIDKNDQYLAIIYENE